MDKNFLTNTNKKNTNTNTTSKTAERAVAAASAEITENTSSFYQLSSNSNESSGISSGDGGATSSSRNSNSNSISSENNGSPEEPQSSQMMHDSPDNTDSNSNSNSNSPSNNANDMTDSNSNSSSININTDNSSSQQSSTGNRNGDFYTSNSNSSSNSNSNSNELLPITTVSQQQEQQQRQQTEDYMATDQREHAVISQSDATSIVNTGSMTREQTRRLSAPVSNSTTGNQAPPSNSTQSPLQSHLTVLTRFVRTILDSIPPIGSSSSVSSLTAGLGSDFKAKSKLYEQLLNESLKRQTNSDGEHLIFSLTLKEHSTSSTSTSSSHRLATFQPIQTHESTNFKSSRFAKLIKLMQVTENYYCVLVLPNPIQSSSSLYASTSSSSSIMSSSGSSSSLSSSPTGTSSSSLLASAMDAFTSPLSSSINSGGCMSDFFEDAFTASQQVNANDIDLLNQILSTHSHTRKSRFQVRLTHQNSSHAQPSPPNAFAMNTEPFYLCALCHFYIVEPITLVCGCTYCKDCLEEYNHIQTKSGALVSNPLAIIFKRASPSASSTQQSPPSSVQSSSPSMQSSGGGLGGAGSNSQSSQSSSSGSNSNSSSSSNASMSSSKLYKCKVCDYVHPHNSSKYLKMNVTISKINEKVFAHSIEVRLLRNDIRKAICLKRIDFERAIDLLQKAYNLDTTNHLILADLFLLNYFNQNFEACVKLANKSIAVAPKWPFSYFMKSLTHQMSNDYQKQKDDLITCLELDNSLDYVRIKLCKLLKQTNAFNLGSYMELITSDYFSNQHGCKRSHSYNREQEKERDLHAKKFHSNTGVDSEMSHDSAIQEDDSQNETNSAAKSFKHQLLRTSDLECSLCLRLLYKPVTTPCGHMFCCACLDRALDHRDKCPLCTSSLSEYLAERRQSRTKYVQRIIKTYFVDDFLERKRIHEDEMTELMENEREIPIFVCTLALPTIECPLHIYEPRYRLMLRRALLTTKRFGMCAYVEENPGNYANYGCVLQINRERFLRDGRAVVETVGSRRFRVLSRNVRDGYNIASVEWIKDLEISDERERAAFEELNVEVYALGTRWFNYLSPQKRAIIMNSFGTDQMPEISTVASSNPENGPSWHWFLLNILPLENRLKLIFLSSNNYRARLMKLKVILNFLIHSYESQGVPAQVQSPQHDPSQQARDQQQQQQQQQEQQETQQVMMEENQQQQQPQLYHQEQPMQQEDQSEHETEMQEDNEQ